MYNVLLWSINHTACISLFQEIDDDAAGAVRLHGVQRVCVTVWPYLDPRSLNIAVSPTDCIQNDRDLRDLK